jgi:hypothetical protein
MAHIKKYIGVKLELELLESLETQKEKNLLELDITVPMQKQVVHKKWLVMIGKSVNIDVVNNFDKILNKFLLKEDALNLNGSGAKAVTSPQFQQVIKNVQNQAGAQGDILKALGASLMGDEHVQDFNKLLDPKNTEYKNVDDFLKKHQDLAPRFAELGLIQPKPAPDQKSQDTDKKQNQTPSISNSTSTDNSTSYGGQLQGV